MQATRNFFDFGGKLKYPTLQQSQQWSSLSQGQNFLGTIQIGIVTRFNSQRFLCRFKVVATETDKYPSVHYRTQRNFPCILVNCDIMYLTAERLKFSASQKKFKFMCHKRHSVLHLKRPLGEGTVGMFMLSTQCRVSLSNLTVRQNSWARRAK